MSFLGSTEATLVGTYSSNTSIDISSYSNKTVEAFYVKIDSGSASCGNASTGTIGSIRGSCSFSPPSISISGDTLSLVVGRLSISASSMTGAGSCSGASNVSTSLYYIGG